MIGLNLFFYKRKEAFNKPEVSLASLQIHVCFGAIKNLLSEKHLNKKIMGETTLFVSQAFWSPHDSEPRTLKLRHVWGSFFFFGFSTVFMKMLTKVIKVVILLSGHKTGLSMKKRIISLRTIASTLLLAITTAFFLTSVPASAKPVPITSQEVKIAPTDLPVALINTDNYQPAVSENKNGIAISNSGNFAEASSWQKVPMLYAKKITAHNTGKNMTAGNYRGKQLFHRMM